MKEDLLVKEKSLEIAKEDLSVKEKSLAIAKEDLLVKEKSLAIKNPFSETINLKMQASK